MNILTKCENMKKNINLKKCYFIEKLNFQKNVKIRQKNMVDETTKILIEW